MSFGFYSKHLLPEPTLSVRLTYLSETSYWLFIGTNDVYEYHQDVCKVDYNILVAQEGYFSNETTD